MSLNGESAEGAGSGQCRQTSGVNHRREVISWKSLSSESTVVISNPPTRARNESWEGRDLGSKHLPTSKVVDEGEENPFEGARHGSIILDPRSSNFNPRAWAQTLIGMQARDQETSSHRTAGFTFRNLGAYGYGSTSDYQKDVANIWLQTDALVRKITGIGKRKIQILQWFDGLVESGEMLVVLGRPGSGCSTFLKTISGETHGFKVDEKSEINYQGISAGQMHNQFRGEAIYTAETDVHFPQLTVGETLSFAAKARAPRNRPPNISHNQYAEHMKDVIMTMLGLNHTMNSKIGDDIIRGISGGERKRVTIAEAALSGSPLHCWDNSTRGLDSANALEFCKMLRLETELSGSTACVAIYQAPQAAYEIFDKVIVLYEGRQIYFGRTQDARDFFTAMGFECPRRQTTADFLTSLTSPLERVVKPGYEDKVPRTADEFVAAWKTSLEYAQLIVDIEDYCDEFPVGGESVQDFENSRRIQQARRQRVKSPYTLAVTQQIQLCMARGFQRLKGDASITLTQLIGNFIMALVIASIFYDLPTDTSSFYSRGALIFFSLLLNSFASALEILTLYAQRPIVEKHARYALYHPFAEAVSSMICDLPYKIVNAITFNLPLYFMTNLRRELGAFFIFLLFSFVSTLTMSMIYRTIGAASRTLAQALVPAAIILLALIIYAGFILPVLDMGPWFRWINYLNPIAYSFESLMLNEFYGRSYPCATLVPQGRDYLDIAWTNQACSAVGATAGSNVVLGETYLRNSFRLSPHHLWRNLGIIFAFMVFYMITYLYSTEYISAAKSKGEILLFRRGQAPTAKQTATPDLEMAPNAGEKLEEALDRQVSATIQRQTAIFQWKDICYDIKIKKETRRILDHVDGWVKPGTLTALMGVSGAGKTTLLDVLATRATLGVVSGEALVDGRPRDASFQRKTGYVQQQDLHLETSTVREALQFSALLRQPASTSKQEKLDYVEEVIRLLDMETYAGAIVGVPGEGLNVEQRKRLTIGVELAAKPQLLLFLDEPTSGLDSQTSWAILDLLKKLTGHGQAILCTIHQPSAMLFQRFDRLLFLAAGGKPIYFGEIGESSSTLTRYFENNGATPCLVTANPAEWMMEVIGAAPGTTSKIDWPKVWLRSPERAAVHWELDSMKRNLSRISHPRLLSQSDEYTHQAFAAPLLTQLRLCLGRIFTQYWRTPTYIYSKTLLSILTSLFIGLSFFHPPNSTASSNSQQSLQNQMLGIFMLTTIFGNIVQQIFPLYIAQRSLFETRERQSNTYSWIVFLASNILVELPWNSLMALIIWAGWHFPSSPLLLNPTDTLSTDTIISRSLMMLALVWSFLIFASTFAHMIIAGIEVAQEAANLANLLFVFSIAFCGVLASPGNGLPKFWIWMYRVSPFSYLVGGMLGVGVEGVQVRCSEVELLRFDPPSLSSSFAQTCAEYMTPFIRQNGGYLANPDATTDCRFCPVSSADTFLDRIGAGGGWNVWWRDFGFLWIYIFVNLVGAVGFYWLARVPKKGKTDGKADGKADGKKEEKDKDKDKKHNQFGKTRRFRLWKK